MKIITTTYNGPDLDGYGCAVAYAELLRSQGKDAQAHVWDDPHIEVQWLFETFNLPRALGPVDDKDAQTVLLDCSSPEDMPGSFNLDQVVEIIDHRKVFKVDEFKNAKVQIEPVGAAATLVAERFKKLGINPSKESALYLLGGIISNTQNFTAVATDRDREMAKWLKEISNAPDDLAKQMFIAKSDLSGDRLQQTLKNDFKVVQIQNITAAITQLEIVGVLDLVARRRDELEDFLLDLKKQHDSDLTFVNMKELETGESYILCADEKTRDFLANMPDVDWTDGLGHSKTLTLRKHIANWIKKELDKS